MKAWRIISAAAVAVVGAWILYTFPNGPGSFYPPCVFRKITGLLCPGCGTTHALRALVHGHFADAFRYNPFVFAVMLGSVYASPSLLRGETPPLFLKSWFGWTAFAVVMAWWILRNLF